MQGVDLGIRQGRRCFGARRRSDGYVEDRQTPRTPPGPKAVIVQKLTPAQSAGVQGVDLGIRQGRRCFGARRRSDGYVEDRQTPGTPPGPKAVIVQKLTPAQSAGVQGVDLGIRQGRRCFGARRRSDGYVEDRQTPRTPPGAQRCPLHAGTSRGRRPTPSSPQTRTWSPWWPHPCSSPAGIPGSALPPPRRSWRRPQRPRHRAE